MSGSLSQVESRGATPLVCCAVALAIMASFALISSDWSMSEQFHEIEGLAFHKQSKKLEQRQFDASETSAAGFLLLGFAGAVAAVRKPLRPTDWTHPVVVACLPFAFWCALSILWSPSPGLSLRKIAILAVFLTGTIGLARVIELRDLCWVAAITCAGFLAYGLVAEISQGSFHPGRHGYRFCGTFHPNDQGLHCAILVLAAACLLWQGTRHVWLVGCILLAGSAGLLMTKSRTALAALACALAFGILLRAQGKYRILLASSLTALACIAIVAYSFLPVGITKSTEDLASLGRSGNVESLTGRIPLWQQLSREIGERPWLGSSYGGFWNTDHIRRYSDMFEWQIPNAHNAYFDLVLSVGIVGLGLYLTWILAAWLAALFEYERTGDAGVLFALCLITFSIVHGFAESKFPFPGMGSAFLFLAVFVVTARTVPRSVTPTSRESTIRRDWPPVGWRLAPASSRER